MSCVPTAQLELLGCSLHLHPNVVKVLPGSTNTEQLRSAGWDGKHVDGPKDDLAFIHPIQLNSCPFSKREQGCVLQQAGTESAA